MVWYGMVWYGMVWYGMVWYGKHGKYGMHVYNSSIMQSHAAPNKNCRWIRGFPYKHDPHVCGARGKLTSSNQ